MGAVFELLEPYQYLAQVFKHVRLHPLDKLLLQLVFNSLYLFEHRL